MIRVSQPAQGHTSTPSSQAEMQMWSASSAKGIRSLLTNRLVALVTISVFTVGVWFLPTNEQEPTQASLRSTHREENQCTIFLAPSSIKGIAALGLYTTRDISENESILTQSDISIPVVDYWEGVPESQEKARNQWNNLFGEYWWARGVAEHVKYEADLSMDIQINFGAFPNHHCILNSLTYRYPVPPYDDTLLNRQTDPGIGAFTYSMGRDFYVHRDIHAGDEIFLNYGYCQRDDIDESFWASNIPVTEDFNKAAEASKKLYKKYKDKGKLKVNKEVKIPPDTDPRVASLIPKSTAELREVVKSEEDLVMALARKMSVEHRSLEWIRSNGMCIDNLTARKSLLPHAGHGAFAQRFIPKGEMVVPVPMLHAADKEVFNIYDQDGAKRGQQLLLNYCFGHPESSLLLCPLTNAVLINHCSKRRKQCGSKGPNAQYQWSSGWQPTSNEWLKKSVKEIGNEIYRGLSMEIVALRDIKPGEEVYIDYGEAWEDAWEKHVANYKPPPPLMSADGKTEEPFVTAKEANEKEGPLDLLVSNDLREIPSHPYLFTGCQYRLGSDFETEKDIDGTWDEPNAKWEKLSDAKILERYADDGSFYKDGYTYHGDGTYWPCSILLTEKNGDSYVVRIHQHKRHYQQKWDENDLPKLLTNYPREAIHYFVKPYASDQNLPGVFRHEIGIRDEIFPAQWKNLKKTKKSD